VCSQHVAEFYQGLNRRRSRFFNPLCELCFGASDAAFPHANQAAVDTLAVPIYPELTAEQIGFVVETIKQFIA
jgi:dTDP-4-amino-4,6-dideoxygalactose transaminase